MIEERIVERVFQFYRLIKSEVDCSFSHERLSLIHLHILFFVNKKKEVSHKKLAKMLNVSLPTTTDLTDRLVKKGFLTRVHSNQDRRFVFLKLTKRGQEMIKKLKEMNCQKLRKRFEQLNSNEKKLLLKLLEKLLKVK